jgi:hypothetical protein
MKAAAEMCKEVCIRSLVTSSSKFIMAVTRHKLTFHSRGTKIPGNAGTLNTKTAVIQIHNKASSTDYINDCHPVMLLLPFNTIQGQSKHNFCYIAKCSAVTCFDTIPAPPPPPPPPPFHKSNNQKVESAYYVTHYITRSYNLQFLDSKVSF